TRKQYADEVKKAEQALGVNDYRLAAAHFEAANKVLPSADMEKKMRHVQAQSHVQAGQAAKRDGRLADARSEFQQALALEALPDVQRELDVLTAALALQGKIDEGQKAADAGNWDMALRVWTEALDSKPHDREEEINKKIANAR